MANFHTRFDRCLQLFADARDKEGSALSMYAFAVDAGGFQRNHVFGGKDESADLRSVSKVVAGLVLGHLISAGTVVGDHPITLETEIEPLLRQHMSANARRHWRKVRVVDLLNNTIGHKEGFLFRKDLGKRPESEYLTYIFDSPIDHEPGSHFSYSNVGPFLFSVLLQDWLTKSLHALAREIVLDPLEIQSEWRCFADYTAGCTGLSVINGDLIKLAALLRNGGALGERTIVPESWVREMTRPRTLTPSMFDAARVFPKFAYGIGLWVCENGSYYCDGTNGQYLVVIPGTGAAISTTGDQADMKPITKCMLPFL